MEDISFFNELSNLSNFNSLDIFIFVSFAVILFISWHRGLLLSLYNLCSFIIAVVLANFIYPKIGGFLRGNNQIYTRLTDFVADSMGLEEVLDSSAKAVQNQLIESLGMPGKITDTLIENNNPEIYKIFNVSAVEEYVVGIIVNILINVIAMAAVFLIVSLILALISRSLNVVSKLPVIKSFNKIGGLLLGCFLSTVFIWLAFVVMFLFFPKNFREISSLINTSVLAKYFFENNIFMEMILSIKY